MFGPVDGGTFPAILTTSVDIGPGMVVTEAEIAEAIVLDGLDVSGAGAVALKYATDPAVVLTATNDSTPPLLLVVRVIVDRPFENFAL